jgi:hypothetical protein
MRFRVSAVAIAATLAALLGSASARADGTLTNYTTRCSASHNACETVANLYKGSDYVLSVRVWSEHSSDRHTMRVPFDGVPRVSQSWDVEYPGLRSAAGELTVTSAPPGRSWV